MSYTNLRIHPAIGIARGAAARFSIYQYQFDSPDGIESYPTGSGAEVRIGSQVDGKTVTDIIWTVHLANKKAETWRCGQGAGPFLNGQLPKLRNPDFGTRAGSEQRLRKLVLDAGPRALAVSAGESVGFDSETVPTFCEKSLASISELPDYPVFLADVVETLAELSSESCGCLIVSGARGIRSGFDIQGRAVPNLPLPEGGANNDYWMDDTSDGPVTALLLFEDGTSRAVDGNAWVISSAPADDEQALSVLTLWDELYSTWVEQLQLRPELFSGGEYNSEFKADFDQDVLPTLRAAVTMPVPPDMAEQGLIKVTRSQYHAVSQWSRGHHLAGGVKSPVLGKGEALDKAALYSCLSGSFSPGREISFIFRDINLYRQDWTHHANGGPFRINMRPLDYRSAVKERPFLSSGYIPLRKTRVEPGDLSKFTALPQPEGGAPVAEPGRNSRSSGENSTKLFFSSWPEKSPVAVYVSNDISINSEAGLVVENHKNDGRAQ